MKRSIFSLLLMLMLILAGCSGSEEAESGSALEAGKTGPAISETSESSTEANESSAEESADASIEVSLDTEVSEEPIHIPDQNENPLTGLYDVTDAAVNKRPVAIMVNNVRASLPQYGIAEADIIFEMPAEGGLTRFMAMYADYTTIPSVCSIRSCRKYFPAVSEGFDAIYVNCGRNSVINSYLASLDLTQYDGALDDRLFARDQDRLSAGYGREHTVYFDGPSLPKILEEDGARVDIEEDKIGNAFNFNDEAVVPSGDVCEYVHLDFGSNKSGFTYDAASNTYLKDFRGNPQMDGRAETQLAFTNVIILETEIGDDPNGKHKSVNWKGGSDHIGYYLSNGHIQTITWSKESEEARLMLFDENGNELSINRGKSYIAFGFIGKTTFEK